MIECPRSLHCTMYGRDLTCFICHCISPPSVSINSGLELEGWKIRIVDEEDDTFTDLWNIINDEQCQECRDAW